MILTKELAAELAANGDRIALLEGIDNYPFVHAPAGMRGTVQEFVDDHILIVQIDKSDAKFLNGYDEREWLDNDWMPREVQIEMHDDDEINVTLLS